jgi:hypothetical protein
MATKKTNTTKDTKKQSVTFNIETLGNINELKGMYTKTDENGKPFKGQNTVSWADVTTLLYEVTENSKFSNGKTMIENRVLKMIHLSFNGRITTNLLRTEIYNNGTKNVKVDLKSVQAVMSAYSEEINLHNLKFDK